MIACRRKGFTPLPLIVSISSITALLPIGWAGLAVLAKGGTFPSQFRSLGELSPTFVGYPPTFVSLQLPTFSCKRLTACSAFPQGLWNDDHFSGQEIRPAS